MYRLLAAPGLGELIGGVMWPGLLRAALSRCFAEPRREEVDFLVRTGYPIRVSPEGRAAFLSALRSVRADFIAEGDRYRRALASLSPPVLLIHGRQDRVVPPVHPQTIAGHLRAFRGDRAPERDDRYIGRPAADIEHHGADCLGDWQLRTNCAGNRFLNDYRFARARVLRSIAHRATLHIRHARRHADHNSRAEEPCTTSLRFVDEIGE